MYVVSLQIIGHSINLFMTCIRGGRKLTITRELFSRSDREEIPLRHNTEVSRGYSGIEPAVAVTETGKSIF
jgi:hypothetical protein